MTERRQLEKRGKALLGVILWGCVVLAAVTSCVNRYCQSPPEDPATEIVVSACQHPRLHSVSPDGRFILYSTGTEGAYQMWSLDTTTGTHQPDTGCGAVWLTNTLRLAQSRPSSGPDWKFTVCDMSDDSRTPVQWVQEMTGTTSRREDGTLVFSPQVVEWFRQAERVYYTDQPINMAIALASDFKAYPENNYALATPRKTYKWGDDEAILLFLEENKIDYIHINTPAMWGRQGGLPSHDGRFIARGSVIRTADGAQVIARSPSHLSGGAAGWAYDDSGVYYQPPSGGELSVIGPPAPIYPILKLKVPKEYLLPEAR